MVQRTRTQRHGVEIAASPFCLMKTSRGTQNENFFTKWFLVMWLTWLIFGWLSLLGRATGWLYENWDIGGFYIMATKLIGRKIS